LQKLFFIRVSTIQAEIFHVVRDGSPKVSERGLKNLFFSSEIYKAKDIYLCHIYVCSPKRPKNRIQVIFEIYFAVLFTAFDQLSVGLPPEVHSLREPITPDVRSAWIFSLSSRDDTFLDCKSHACFVLDSSSHEELSLEGITILGGHSSEGGVVCYQYILGITSNSVDNRIVHLVSTYYFSLEKIPIVTIMKIHNSIFTREK